MNLTVDFKLLQVSMEGIGIIGHAPTFHTNTEIPESGNGEMGSIY